MNYHLTLFWNGKRVMDARCTAVVAYDVARGHIEFQFAGRKMQDWVADTFGNRNARVNLRKILAMPIGAEHCINMGYEDETAFAGFTIERIWTDADQAALESNQGILYQYGL